MHITIVKVGGAVVEDEAQLALLLRGFEQIEGPKILVHGGGRRATKVAAALGIATQMVDGRRITDADTLEVVTMVYGGLVNKHIVAALQAIGVNAIGLTGADMDVIRSHRRPPKDGIDYGFVGDVDRVDALRLKALAEAGLTPVIAPLTHDGAGTMLNTNADTIASQVARAMAQLCDVTLTYCFEKPGVLACPDRDDSVIPLITPQSFKDLAHDGTISGGMLPKVENAIAAVQAGVSRVVITNVSSISQPGRGTTVSM